MKPTTLLICMLGWFSAASALPENGIHKELGETVLSDEIKVEAPKTPVKSEVNPEADSISAFGQVDSFNELAILQRKFVPKRQRVEFHLGFGILADNAFFETQTFSARLGYSFMETLGVEAIGYTASTKNSRASNDLKNNGGVLSGVTSIPKGYFGLDAKWSPIYGKLAFWNKSIVPVEQFFLLGGGQTEQKGLKGSFTVHLGTGFSFGIYQWLAFRAGVDVYDYTTEAKDHFTDTHLNIGISTFFPEVEYR